MSAAMAPGATASLLSESAATVDRDDSTRMEPAHELDTVLRELSIMQAMITAFGSLMLLLVVMLSYGGPGLFCYLITPTIISGSVGSQQRCLDHTAGQALGLREIYLDDMVQAVVVSTAVCVLTTMVSSVMIRSGCCCNTASSSQHSTTSRDNGSSSSSNGVDRACVAVWAAIMILGCAANAVCHHSSVGEQVLQSCKVFVAYAWLSQWLVGREN